MKSVKSGFLSVCMVAVLLGAGLAGTASEPGACCDPATGNCYISEQEQCDQHWLGPNTTCEDCLPIQIEQACCLPNGDCVDIPPEQCLAHGGQPMGPGTTCETTDCSCDWQENDPAKWIQLPDKTPNGIDIKVDGMQILADDFECKQTGPITDIHLWGSWLYDIKGRIHRIELSIYTDDPVGRPGTDPNNTFSRPDRQIWQREFVPGEFTEKLYYTMPDSIAAGEWWWDPAGAARPTPDADRQIWQINMCMNADEPNVFYQRGSEDNPIIYWLAVRAHTQGGHFGLKTRRGPEHSIDDAVWDRGSELPRIWNELIYPKEHPYHPNSIDLAFVITGKDIYEPKPPVKHLKWSQPPVEIDPASRIPTYCGWDEPSFVANYYVGRVAADDFRCLGTMPVRSLHWWGSYVGWQEPYPPQQQPVAWWMGIWSNVPADPITGYSYPHRLLWQSAVPADRVHQEYVGNDLWADPCTALSDACFQYYVDLDLKEWIWQDQRYSRRWFWQDMYGSDTIDNVYWLSIAAIYPNDQVDPRHPWGWKTRPRPWMDDAVTFKLELPHTSSVVLEPCDVEPIKNPTTGVGQDLAFELDTDPNWIKWEQPFTGIRRWPHYEDEKSMAIVDAAGNFHIMRRVADDWKCEQQSPVTAAAWWGSYLGYQYAPCQDFQMILPVKPDYFLLSIWTDVAADADPGVPFSHPGEMIWQYAAHRYDEVLVGYDKHHDSASEPSGWWEPVFRYSVRLPEELWFRQKADSKVLWFSVMAVYATRDPLYDWGWTNHKHVFHDDAAAWQLVQAGGVAEWKWVELYSEQAQESIDMSFMLFTQPCLVPGESVGGNYITPHMYHLWVSLGKPQCWCCPCHSRGDANCDCIINAIDVLALRAAWPGFHGTYDPCVDSNNDGRINAADVLALRAAWPGFGGPGCSGVPGCP